MFLLRLSPRQTLSTILLLGTLLRDNYVTGFPAEGLRTIAADMESAQQPIARVEKRAPVAQPGTQRSAPFPAQTDALVARKEVAPPAITEAEGLEPAQPAITAAPELEERWVDFCNGCEGSTGVTSFRDATKSLTKDCHKYPHARKTRVKTKTKVRFWTDNCLTTVTRKTTVNMYILWVRPEGFAAPNNHHH